MANRQIQTQHRGHGPTISPTSKRKPQAGLVRGQPVKSNTAPWFLKTWGSRPASKLRPVADVAT